ncbi:hypothetical protein N5853_11130 [Bartonella sp. HY329]|uniref:hypothetical protein n=1 Tax=unclassified Bartonella TaxID=2645622 RepID=UPI0021C91C1A|nr:MULTISPECIES: hypothetical protein [unclassified Bartonella]UXM94645.1 hypothetical protein N5853_11130 [Bartonella sp. HY329]UXN08968.1 hypothetical protein N5852_11140 [Bartonella sp. HY328]
MDLSTIIQKEQSYTLDMLHPVTFEPIGVKFFIRSAESDIAKAKQREIIDLIQERHISKKQVKASQAIEWEIDKAVSYIIDWDFNDNDFNGEKPIFSTAKAKEILQSTDWIFAQVVEAANRLANFTKP